MVTWTVHYDMRAPGFGTPAPALYAAALEQAAWLDARGVTALVVSEHHGADDGYLPAPLVMAGAMAARTSRAMISVNALALPLHNPIAAAEQCQVVDQISGGRLALTLVPGYVESEFALYDVPFAGRGTAFDDKLAVFLQALTGEPFEHAGRTVQVTPGPVQRPRPMVFIGGASRAAARRAARFGDGFALGGPERGLGDAYREACAALGRTPGPVLVPPQPMAVHVADDPEAAWARIAPHALHELNRYSAWAAGFEGHLYERVTDADQARKDGFYAVLTPDECVDVARRLEADNSTVLFKPLIGGLDPEVSWASFELFVSKVLPALDR
ncbi:MAG: LLM class flavin-dependent oxidoreductase [Acidimicrobiales bacterium]|nr:LLM class flavin-dependent oxidoreductase [Acidimicrobiales bacterium]